MPKQSKSDRRNQLTIPTNGAGRPAETPSVKFHEAANANDATPANSLKTQKKTVQVRSNGQKRTVEAMTSADMTFVTGPAGTGKTYLAIAYGISLLLAGKVDRIVLSRPAVEAGENLGFLPGDMREKIDPYLRPLWDAIHDMLPAERVAALMGEGKIEIAPLAFMRGRTLAKAFIILDEAQNTTVPQLKMAITRLGEGSVMVITGDEEQTDLPNGVESGLAYMTKHLKGVEGINMVEMSSKDVVRHKLVGKIIDKLQVVQKAARAERKVTAGSTKRASPTAP